MRTVENTFNLTPLKVDERELRQVREAREVACSRGSMGVGVSNMDNFPGTFSCCLEASMTHNDPDHCFVSTVGTMDVTFNQLAVVEVDGSQLRQGRQAREVSCSRKLRMRECQHGELF